MKTIRRLSLALLAFLPMLPASAEAREAEAPIAFSQVGAKATAEYHGEAIGITATAEGARLHTAFQKLSGTVTSEGLWLDSTVENNGRLQVCASALGRGHALQRLPATGTVRAGESSVVFDRPGLTEEYSVSVDGVRQDFIVAERPAGTGVLSVELTVRGARAEAASYGAKLTLDGSQRVLAYSRLRVTDARGRELSATLLVPAADRLTVSVEDAQAAYPIRIDPTFSDADWVSLNSGVAGANQYVSAVVVQGSNLYIGGAFTVAGTAAASHVAKWDGNAWSALGTGTDGEVTALAADGAGNLYVGGYFTSAGGVLNTHGLAKWNGGGWLPLGSGMDDDVYALVWDGAGNLYAGGFFSAAGGVANTGGIAKWNGTVWSALGTGMDLTDGTTVRALAWDATGILYAGGDFSKAGGVTASRVAKWNGTAWSALGSGIKAIIGKGVDAVPSAVAALAVDGDGNLYVGGNFAAAGAVAAVNIAKWSGSAWSKLGAAGSDNAIEALAVDGAGNVYAGGQISTIDGVEVDGVAKWDGSVWSALGTNTTFAGGPRALALDAAGNLYAGGVFPAMGGVGASNLAKWDGSAWSALGSGMNATASVMAVDGSGNLYIGGGFTSIGGVAANFIARWNGSAWSALGTGMNARVRALAVGADGKLYASGDFLTAGGVVVNHFAQWDGSAWSALGTGSTRITQGVAFALATDGLGNLYAGGSNFKIGVSGGPTPPTVLSGVVKWNGSAWSALGTGLNSGANVRSLVVSGTNTLYAGGIMSIKGGAPGIITLAKWDGSAWSALDPQFKQVDKLSADGTGNLYAAGSFSSVAGAAPKIGIAQWNGSAWSVLVQHQVGGPAGTVNALACDAAGNLFAGGTFTIINGVPANRIAKWDGTVWSAIGTGADNSVSALAADTHGHLFLGGAFGVVGSSTVSPFLAQANLNGTAKIEVAEAGNPLVDGVSIVAFGVVAPGDTSEKTFTITNPGTLDLTSLAITGETGEFVVSSPSATTVAAGGPAVTFTVTFTPTTDQLITTTLHITSNAEGAKNPFDITLYGGNTQPVLAMHANVGPIEATGPDGAVVTYDAGSVTQGVNPTITYSKASGTTFPVGVTTVIITARDDLGLVATTTFTVTVSDTTAPQLTVPADIIKQATSATGAIVSFAATATDAVTDEPTITYSPDSGTLFPMGPTTVTVTAEDAAHNMSAPATFTVTVVTPHIAVTEVDTSTVLTSGAPLNLGTFAAGFAVRSDFQVDNSGTGDLTGLYVTVEGVDQGMFTIVKTPTAPLESNHHTTFTVQANLSGTGTKSASIRIATNDLDAPVFIINVTATVAPPAPTQAAADITTSTATLKGTVNAKGNLRAVSFDYGTTNAYGTTLPATPATLSSSTDEPVSLAAVGLPPHAVVHFRVRASGDLGGAVGKDLTFTTLNTPPVAAVDSFDIAQTVTLLPVLANDTDIDGDLATFAVASISTALSPSSAGKLTLAKGKLTFTASTDFLSGATPATFSYTMTDGFGGTSAPALVTLTPGTVGLNPDNRSVVAAGETYAITVTAGGPWSVGVLPKWVTVTPLSSSGNGSVSVTVQPNAANVSRTGTFKVGPATHTITQDDVIKPTIRPMPQMDYDAIVGGPFSLLIPTQGGPVTYKATNLPSGLTLSNVTGLITGVPKTAGDFAVTVTAANKDSAADDTLAFNIHVAALAPGLVGTFHGLVDRNPVLNGGLASRLEIATTPLGAFSGKLITGTKATTLKGAFGSVTSTDAHVVIVIATPPSTLDVTLTAATGKLIGTLSDGGSNTVNVQGWRNGWADLADKAASVAGAYSFYLAQPDANPGLPQGFGYGTFTVDAVKGTLTVAGKLPDDTKLSGATHVGPNGQVLIYVPYTGGSLAGVLTLTSGANAPLDNTLAGTPDWLKPRATALYPAGFGPVPLDAAGGLYTAPTTGNLVLGLTAGSANASLAFSLGGLDAETKEFNQLETITATGLKNTAVPSGANPNRVNLSTLKADTGEIGGDFTLKGATAPFDRKALFYGQIVTTADGTKGYGYFLLAKPPAGAQTVATSPKLSGAVELSTPPAAGRPPTAP